MFTNLCIKLKGVMSALKRDERGVSALEYVILAAVVVGAVSLAAPVLQDVISNAFTTIGSTVTDCVNSPSSCGAEAGG